jgi:alkylated DNA repair dioxygenase AlkB
MRYTEQSAKKAPSGQRRLLRPVYWLGNWQFACLNYYKPPERTKHVCVKAESYPPVLARLVEKAEKITKQTFKRSDIPSGWHLNTCLINYYGDQNVDGKWIDCARVGEHKDFEPGPVASMSFGERAFFSVRPKLSQRCSINACVSAMA